MRVSNNPIAKKKKKHKEENPLLKFIWLHSFSTTDDIDEQTNDQ